MENNKADILLIRQYLNGELDERAMYLLERRAQDDPELMDLMMGMEMGNRQQDEENLQAINQLIKDRVAVKETKKLYPWRSWSVAASALLCISIAGYLMFKQPQQKEQLNTLQQERQAKRKLQAPGNGQNDQQSNTQKSPLQKPVLVDSILAGKTAEMLAANKKTVIVKSRIRQTGADQAVLRQDAINPKSAQAMAAVTMARVQPAVDSMMQSSNSLAEITVVARAAPQKKEAIASAQYKLTDSSTLQALQGRVAGIQIGQKAAVAVKTFIVTGIVTDALGNMPLPGVAVRLTNGQNATTTDQKGKFSIEVPEQNAALQVSMIGFEQKQVNVKTNQTALNIALTEDHQALAEVVVVGYGRAKKATTKVQPLEGWPFYQKYLDQATASYRQKGKVSLSFNIDQQGTPINIKVNKSSGKPALDEIARQIILIGPKWQSGTDPEKQLNLTLKF